MPEYNGVYKLVSSENLDAFLKAMGVNALMRRAAAAGTPTITVSVSGDHWKLVQDTKLRSNTMEFDLGVAREVKSLEGDAATSVITKDGDTLVEKRSCAGGRQVLILREFSDRELKVTMTANGVTATRVFQRQ